MLESFIVINPRWSAAVPLIKTWLLAKSCGLTNAITRSNAASKHNILLVGRLFGSRFGCILFVGRADDVKHKAMDNQVRSTAHDNNAECGVLKVE